jgi:hypothetical protein
MSEKQLHTNRPTERVDTKVRELWIELDPLPGSGLADFVIGLRVDVLIEPNSTVARPSSPISELGQVPPASTSNRPTRNRRESAPFLDPAGTELKAGRDENAAGSLGSSSVDLVSTPLLPPSTRSPRP